jgi:excisionase family DNA binding protein
VVKPRERVPTDPSPPATGPERTDLLTYAEAAEQLRVHPRTIRNWADAGRLKKVELSHQIQRVTAESVERLIRESLAST